MKDLTSIIHNICKLFSMKKIKNCKLDNAAFFYLILSLIVGLFLFMNEISLNSFIFYCFHSFFRICLLWFLSYFTCFLLKFVWLFWSNVCRKQSKDMRLNEINTQLIIIIIERKTCVTEEDRRYSRLFALYEKYKN